MVFLVPIFVGCVSRSASIQTCEVDADCVVVRAIAGHPDAPSWWESCDNTCYTGVQHDEVEAWDSLRRDVGPSIRCSVNFEPCPPAEDFGPECQWGRCRAGYLGG